MSTTQGRLGKLYPALTAKERALLVLQAWKEDGEEDPLVRRTMPAEQATEFNRYIGLMNGVNVRLATYIVHGSAAVSQLGTKSGWLASLHLWGIDAWKLAAYIFLHTKEPVTKSEHRRLVEKARSEMIPLRVKTVKEKEIANLVEEGVLDGKRSRRRLVVNAGSFYDWLGEPVPVSPQWGLEFEVFPDEQADKVRRLQEERQAAREALRRAPSDSALEPVFRRFCPDHKRSRETPSWGDQIADALSTSLRQGTEECWRTLKAIEAAVVEIGVEFDGGDPLLPNVGRPPFSIK